MIFLILPLLLINKNNFSDPLFIWVVLIATLTSCRDFDTYKIVTYKTDRTLIVLMMMLIIITLGFFVTTSAAGRLKFASGTSYMGTMLSLVAIYVFQQTISFFNKDQIRKPYFYLLVILLLLSIWAILQTMSRGNVAVLILGLFFVANKSLGVYKSLIAVGLLAGFIVFVGDVSAISGRFADQGSLESYTSGRSLTWLYILGEVQRWDFHQTIFGEGLGSLTNMLKKLELEYPHLDFLILFYDVGLYGSLIVLYMIWKLIGKFGLFPVSMVFLNSLHTNFHLFPGLLIFIIILSDYYPTVFTYQMNANNRRSS